MIINREAVEAWAVELESGNRCQAKGVLHNLDTAPASFCCLGVVSDMAFALGLVERHQEQTTIDVNGSCVDALVMFYGGPENANEVTLSREVRDWLGFTGDLGYLYADDIAKVTPSTRTRIEAETSVSIWDTTGLSLAMLNDKGATFASIAKVIREVWLS